MFDETPLKTSGKDSEFYVDPDMPPSKSLTPIKCSAGVKGKSKYLTDYSGFKAGDECNSPQLGVPFLVGQTRNFHQKREFDFAKFL